MDLPQAAPEHQILYQLKNKQKKTMSIICLITVHTTFHSTLATVFEHLNTYAFVAIKDFITKQTDLSQ